MLDLVTQQTMFTSSTLATISGVRSSLTTETNISSSSSALIIILPTWKSSSDQLHHAGPLSPFCPFHHPDWALAPITRVGEGWSPV
jgi:hypothetical protein